MSSQLFTLFGDLKLSKEIHTQVSKSLKKKEEMRHLAEKTLKTKSKALGRLKFLKLHLLHREFYGPHTTFGRMLVASNRYARKRFHVLRMRLPEGK